MKEKRRVGKGREENRKEEKRREERGRKERRGEENRRKRRKERVESGREGKIIGGRRRDGQKKKKGLKVKYHIKIT